MSLFTNKYFLTGFVVTGIVLFLIYRKKIFKAIPSADKIVDGMIKGNGIAKKPSAAPAAVNSLLPQTSFQANSEGARIVDMLKNSIIKDTALKQDAAKEWAQSGNASFDNTLVDNFQIKSTKPTVSQIMPNHAANRDNMNKPIDFTTIINNQVLMNDVFGKPCGCGRNCSKCETSKLTFN